MSIEPPPSIIKERIIWLERKLRHSSQGTTPADEKSHVSWCVASDLLRIFSKVLQIHHNTADAGISDDIATSEKAAQDFNKFGLFANLITCSTPVFGNELDAGRL